ncbi:MAG: DNA-binding protein WhiA [Bacilli bacterium]|jgi:DNA-binding protein WhiA|nr:DNA-binding protein WhiA [Bacilli bacterium]MCH4201815.1 DNA-binding protein WhiA [Bacilli bacterium]MCH4236093.1 DNA-binding protein WhiA [Bacilli bacterium]
MFDYISFTMMVKEDIVRPKEEGETKYAVARKKAILSAFMRMNGSLSIAARQTRLLLRTENAKVAKYIYSLIKEFYGIDPSFHYQKNMHFKKNTYYIISIDERVDFILDDLSISFLGGAIDRKIVYSDDTASGYATGAFLARGSVNSPKSGNYHLEIATKDEVLAGKLCRLIERFHHANFTPKVIQRRDYHVVYLKKSDQIGEFLIFIGATSSSLQYENVRIDRDMQNASQRMALCDEHNYQRTLSSAQNQIADIKLIEQKIGFNHFDNPKLRLLCELRLNYEDANMQELADRMTEKLASERPISKSNVAHLFRSLNKIAENYRRGN